LLAAITAVLAPRAALAQPTPLPTTPTPASDAAPPSAPPPATPIAAPPTEDVEPAAPPTPPPPTRPPPPADIVDIAPAALRNVQIHGFVSEGAFVTTANNYLGESSRGSLRLFEAGINVSTEAADRLRVGAQLFTRDLANDSTNQVSLDWAFLDYGWRDWLGLRAGRIKVPYGLYNEYQDIDASRTAVLLPQSVYPIEEREILLAQNGVEVYGSPSLGRAGGLDYQAFAGSLNVPTSDEITEARVKSIEGAQLLWRTPIDGLRGGVSLVHANIQLILQLDPASTAALEMMGLLPPGSTGAVQVNEDPTNLWVGSVEYAHDAWLFAGEYSRWIARVDEVPMLQPTTNSDSERFYGLASYRFDERVEAGAYYSVYNVDANERGGHVAEFKDNPALAHQRDAAVTARFDINSAWIVKLEAHLIDGYADLVSPAADNPKPTRYWGMFMARTTVTF
jgi:hypothetical protein